MERQIQSVESVKDAGRAPGMTRQRFVSLDVFRGAAICLMIVVNTPGKGAQLYPYLVHAKWFGFTLADLVFPSFLFAVGNAMSFSQDKLTTAGDDVFLKTVLRRAAIIFLIGYLMYWFPFVRQSADDSWILKPVGETRIMGVLQRIAVCYLLAALVARYCSIRTSVIIAGALLMVYWIVLYWFGDKGRALSMEGNAIVKLDIFLLGEDHIYKKDVIPFDPEGILSSLPAVVNVLAGYWAGIYIRRNGIAAASVLKLVVVGLLFTAAALAWSLVFPFSKKLWTSSFTLYTIGLDILILSVLIFWIEMRKNKAFTNFFVVFGKNPLFIYILSELLYIVLMTITMSDGRSVFEWISVDWFQAVVPGPLGALLTAVVFTMVCWCVAWWLDSRRIYIRI